MIELAGLDAEYVSFQSGVGMYRWEQLELVQQAVAEEPEERAVHVGLAVEGGELVLLGQISLEVAAESSLSAESGSAAGSMELVDE